MRYRYQCIAVVGLGMASLLLGAWLVGQLAPNVMVLLLGVLLVALFTTQGMLVAILWVTTRHNRATAETRPR